MSFVLRKVYLERPFHPVKSKSGKIKVQLNVSHYHQSSTIIAIRLASNICQLMIMMMIISKMMIMMMIIFIMIIIAISPLCWRQPVELQAALCFQQYSPLCWISPEISTWKYQPEKWTWKYHLEHFCFVAEKVTLKNWYTS